jgi:hypothetical protein
LNKFEGVAAIDFDCKTAVLTMKTGASEVKEESVKSALVANGWGMKEFKAGLAELLTVHVFQLTGTKAEDHPALAARLLEEIKGAKQVQIDTGGRAVVTLAKDGELTEASLAATLKAAKDGWSAKSFETKQIPKSMATYVVAVPKMTAADAAKVRETLQALPKVVVVQVFEETKTAQIRLKEPCDKIAADVAAALKAKGFESTTENAAAKSEKTDEKTDEKTEPAAR